MASASPRIQHADPKFVHSLAESDGKAKVISVFLSLDPSEEFALASARDTQVNSIVSEATDQIEQVASSNERVALHEDLEAVERLLHDVGSWGKDASAVAVFRSSELDMFQAAKLPSPVETSVTVKDGPRFIPLVDSLRSGRWCVLLLDRPGASIYLGSPSRLFLIDESDDDVRGQHNNGGFSQGRFERAVEEEVEDHLKRVAQMLFDLQKLKKFDHLVIGATEELTHRMTEHLHPYVGELATERIEVDVENVSRPELERMITDLSEQMEERRATELLERLRYELGSGGEGAAGLKDVLDALNEASVETLLIAQAFDAPGMRCPTCGYLSEESNRCPVDGEDMQPVDSIVDKAIERTVELSAGVKVLDRTELSDLGNIAATLRFNSNQ